MQEKNFFEQLKRSNKYKFKDSSQKKFFFKIDFDDFGAFLEVIDEKKSTLQVDYRNYSGVYREILRTIELIQNRNDFVIDWEKDADNLYLTEHDYLLWQLRNCDNLVGADGKKLVFVEDIAQVTLRLENDPENEALIHSEVVLTQQGETYTNLRPISETYFLSGHQIFQTNPLGNNFQRINLFASTFTKNDLEKYLSLLLSFFQNIHPQYQDYQIEESKETLKPAPTLIFEKIDEDNSLYLRVTYTLPNFEVDFLEQYEVDKVVQVNEIEQVFTLKSIEYQGYEALVAEISDLVQGKQKSKKTSFFQDENLLVIPEDLAQNFIRNHLPTLLNHYQVFGAEKLKSYKIIASRPRLNLALSSGIDFLEGDATLEIEGQHFSLFDVISQYHKNRYVKLADGSQAILNQQYIARLERLFKKQKDKKVRVSFFDLPLVEELIEEKTNEEIFAKSREIFNGFNDLKKQKFQKPKTVQADLRPYQQQGYKWINYLHTQSLGGCLADDMGLGKTLQAITMLSQLYPKETMPTLIVMPKSLLFNWENEVRKFNPTLSYYIFYNQNRDMAEALKSNLIFTTYALLRNNIEVFKEQTFYYVILDESQNIKNLDSQTNKAAMLLNSPS